jgi:hypothetical protein
MCLRNPLTDIEEFRHFKCLIIRAGSGGRRNSGLKFIRRSVES